MNAKYGALGEYLNEIIGAHFEKGSHAPALIADDVKRAIAPVLADKDAEIEHLQAQIPRPGKPNANKPKGMQQMENRSRLHDAIDAVCREHAGIVDGEFTQLIVDAVRDVLMGNRDLTHAPQPGDRVRVHYKDVSYYRAFKDEPYYDSTVSAQSVYVGYRDVKAGRATVEIIRSANETDSCGKCYQCVSPTWGEWESWMVVCATCGNKRCPRAEHHASPCSGSNDPGQQGSPRYPAREW
jgi:hypothetical protein